MEDKGVITAEKAREMADRAYGTQIESIYNAIYNAANGGHYELHVQSRLSEETLKKLKGAGFNVVSFNATAPIGTDKFITNYTVSWRN